MLGKISFSKIGGEMTFFLCLIIAFVAGCILGNWYNSRCSARELDLLIERINEAEKSFLSDREICVHNRSGRKIFIGNDISMEGFPLKDGEKVWLKKSAFNVM